MNKMVDKQKVKRFLHQYAQISIGVIMMNIGFYFFMDPMKLVCGGMFGVSTIITPPIQQVLPWFQASYFLYAANVITLIIGGIFLGKDFFCKTVYASLFSPTITLLLEKTCDNHFFLNMMGNETALRLIISTIIASLTTGAGIGICIKNNGCTGGMDVVQKIMSKYMHVPMSIAMYLTDTIIVLLSGFAFVGGVTYNIANVVFGVLCVFGISYIIDVLALDIRSRRTVYTITKMPTEVKELIYTKVDRGVTFSNVTGGYSGDDMTMVICTMDKNECYRVVELIKELDPDSFTFVTSCKEVAGEFGKRRIV